MLRSADISSVTSFDLLLFIACCYTNVIRRPSLFTLKGFSVFGMYTCTFLFLYGVHVDQSDFFPTARHHSVATPWHHGLPETIRSEVKAHFAAWKAFWAVLFPCKWKKCKWFCQNCCSIDTNQQQTFLSHPSRSFLCLFFWYFLWFLKPSILTLSTKRVLIGPSLSN